MVKKASIEYWPETGAVSLRYGAGESFEFDAAAFFVAWEEGKRLRPADRRAAALAAKGYAVAKGRYGRPRKLPDGLRGAGKAVPRAELEEVKRMFRTGVLRRWDWEAKEWAEAPGKYAFGWAPEVDEVVDAFALTPAAVRAAMALRKKRKRSVALKRREGGWGGAREAGERGAARPMGEAERKAWERAVAQAARECSLAPFEAVFLPAYGGREPRGRLLAKFASEVEKRQRKGL